jgi:hypothetical protein
MIVSENFGGFLKGDTMLTLVRDSFPAVPLELHAGAPRQPNVLDQLHGEVALDLLFSLQGQ